MEFSINQWVETKKDCKFLEILDSENFGDLNLYYTNDGKAYPEDELQPEGVKFFTEFVTLPDEEKNRRLLLSVRESCGFFVWFKLKFLKFLYR